MSAEQLLKHLVGPRFRVPLSEAKKLTRQQVFALYLCPRDKYGDPIEEEVKEKPEDKRERWRQLYRERGWSEERINGMLEGKK